jgi:hypothetical protein
MRTARCEQRNQRREPFVAGNVSKRLAGSALEVVGEKTRFFGCRLRDPEIGLHDPRHRDEAEHRQERRRHQKSDPSRRNKTLAIDRHGVARADDHRER